MDNYDSNVEIDSVVDLEVEVREDLTDPIAELPRVGTLDNGVKPISAGSAEAVAVGPRTDTDACQANAPTGGHAVKHFKSSRGPTVI